AAVKARVPALKPPEDPNTVADLLDYFFTDVRRSLHAHLLQAEALAKSGEAKDARAALEALRQQLDAVESSPELQALSEQLPRTMAALSQGRMTAEVVKAALFADVAPGGTYTWI